jgi:hypothetical protein
MFYMDYDPFLDIVQIKVLSYQCLSFGHYLLKYIRYNKPGSGYPINIFTKI